jgi:hypothetical protein
MFLPKCTVYNSSFNDKQVDNSAVIYSDLSKNLHIEIIIAIIQLKASKDPIFIIDQADITGFDSFSMGGIEYINDFLVYAKHSNPPNIVSIKYDSSSKKVGYRKDLLIKTFSEFQIFPKLVEET